MSAARLDAFARGMICGLAEGGFKQEESVARVKKKDGSHPTLRAVEATLAKARDGPDWRGTDTTAGGRPRELSADEEKQLVDLVFAERGHAKVTTSYRKRRLPFLRRMSKQATCNALHRAGFAWLRRRKKTVVPPDWRPRRKIY